MKARDLMQPARVVVPDAAAEELFEAFADPDQRAVAVVGEDGRMVGLITEEDMLFALLPSYVLDDEALAGALEEAAGAALRRRLEHKRVQDCVNIGRRSRIPVDPDDTLVEVAAAMVRSGDPAVVVVEAGRVLGVITVDILLPALLGTGST
jgi:CBS domain-containing protein